MRMRLAHNHPAIEALEQVFAKMNEVGIKIDCGDPYLGAIVTYDGQEYRLQDIEPGYNVDHFPYEMEYKMTYDNGVEE